MNCKLKNISCTTESENGTKEKHEFKCQFEVQQCMQREKNYNFFWIVA